MNKLKSLYRNGELEEFDFTILIIVLAIAIALVICAIDLTKNVYEPNYVETIDNCNKMLAKPGMTNIGIDDVKLNIEHLRKCHPYLSRKYSNAIDSLEYKLESFQPVDTFYNFIIYKPQMASYE